MSRRQAVAQASGLPFATGTVAPPWCGLVLIGAVLGLTAGWLGAGEAASPAPDDLVPATIVDMRIDPAGMVPQVILATEKKDRFLVIVIGPAEAAAIFTQLRGAPSPPRPMTHDLLKNVITQLGATVQRVVVTRIQDNTFHAEIVLRRGDATLRIDARPSDAMALALRARAPIAVARRVLDEAGLTPDQLREGGEPEKPRPPAADPDWTL